MPKVRQMNRAYRNKFTNREQKNKKYFYGLRKQKHGMCKKHVRASTKLEMAQLLINIHQYSEASQLTFDVNTRYDFENFILGALR